MPHYPGSETMPSHALAQEESVCREEASVVHTRLVVALSAEARGTQSGETFGGEFVLTCGGSID